MYKQKGMLMILFILVNSLMGQAHLLHIVYTSSPHFRKQEKGAGGRMSLPVLPLPNWHETLLD
jgi:hypothetical protein